MPKPIGGDQNESSKQNQRQQLSPEEQGEHLADRYKEDFKPILEKLQEETDMDREEAFMFLTQQSMNTAVTLLEDVRGVAAKAMQQMAMPNPNQLK